MDQMLSGRLVAVGMKSLTVLGSRTGAPEAAVAEDGHLESRDVDEGIDQG